MRKELLTVNTGNPAFAVIMDNQLSVADTTDFVGFYATRDGKNYNFGTHGLMIPNSIVTGFGDDNTTTTHEGFEYNEEMKVWFYDSQSDKFFDVKPGVVINDYTNTTIDKMVFQPISLYKIINATLGEEITLEVDPVLTEVKLTGIDYPDVIKPGSNEAIKLVYIAKNVTEPQFFVSVGKGVVKDNLYIFAPTDTNVVINIVASNVFTGELLTTQIKFTLDTAITSNAVFEDDAVLFYPSSDKLIMKAKKQLVFRLYRKDAGVLKQMVGGPIKEGVTKVIIPGNYQRSWMGQECTINYWVYEGNKLLNKEPIVKTFILK